MTTTRPAGPAGLLLILLLALSACTAAGGPGPGSGAPSASPPPSASPSGGGSDGNAGTEPPDSPIVGDPPVGGGGQPGDPGAGQPNLVVPKPGTIDPHPVAITQLVAQVDGRRVLLNARWWSGVEPCYVLDSIKVDRKGDTFTVSLFEGSAQADAICIEIAMEKVTVIDLGELEPGTYIVQASHGDAAAITVVVE